MRRLALHAGRLLTETVLVLALGVGVGSAFVWLFAPKPTIWNSSPPPEPFLFIEGFFLWLITYVVGKLVYRRLRRGRFIKPTYY
jgi:hypothetical protein